MHKFISYCIFGLLHGAMIGLFFTVILPEHFWTSIFIGAFAGCFGQFIRECWELSGDGFQ